MIIKDDVCIFADEETSLQRDAFLFDRFDLAYENFRVNYYSICDYTIYPGPNGTTGQKMQRKLAVADNDSMTGIGPTAIPDDNIAMLSKDIDYLAFAFVAPL